MNEAAEARGLELYWLGRYQEALEIYSKALVDDPDDPDALAMASMCEASLGRPQEAIVSAKRAVAVAPENAFAYHVLSIAYSDANKLGPAQKAADEAIRLDANDADYLATKAVLCARQNDWRGALKWARAAVEQDADNESAQNIFAQALAITGDVAGARDLGARALHENPESADAHSTNGLVYLRQGKHRDAARHFREALRLEPNNESALEGMKVALRAIFPPYRWYVVAQLWLAGQGKVVRTIVIVLLVVAPRALRALARENPTIAPLFYAAAVPFVLFVWFAWFGDSMMNIMLMFHPLGKFALHKHERFESVVLLILFGFVGAGVGLSNSDYGLALGIISFVGVLLVGLTTNIDDNIRQRKALVWILAVLFIGSGTFLTFLALSATLRR